MEKQLSIIPKPVSIIYKEGHFNSDGLPLISGDNEFKQEIEIVNGQLRNDFEKCGISPNNTGKTISCKKAVKTENDEGYRILINKDNITVEAASGHGM
jgi:N-acetyl-beta-hexosaminidase